MFEVQVVMPEVKRSLNVKQKICFLCGSGPEFILNAGVSEFLELLVSSSVSVVCPRSEQYSLKYVTNIRRCVGQEVCDSPSNRKLESAAVQLFEEVGQISDKCQGYFSDLTNRSQWHFHSY